ncbi:hypothetical protein ACGFSB_23370 [Streptomyces sp. NPDC048441]|uniref:hypothetical protein n=1 Tax=Streptomyces sp. NPDC048441 TaxID=3365552 RepID=UPI00371F9C57
MIRNDDLEPLLRTAPWMSEDGRRAERYERVDHAVLGSAALLLVVAAVGGPAAGQRFFIPVRPRSARATLGVSGPRGVEEALGTEEFNAAVVTRAFSGGQLPTARGGTVRFRGAGGAVREVRRLPFEQGWSSNALSLMDIGGVPHIHKTYRRLDGGVREPELLRRMSGTGHTPEWAGDYTYTDPATGTRHPLGVIYRYAPGDGVDVPLRENLRSLWPRLAEAEGPPADVVRSHLLPLERRLRAAGDFLHAFHRDLAARLGRQVPVEYPVDEALARASGRVRTLAEADVALPAASRKASFAALDAELAALRVVFDRAGVVLGAGPCHGDLHLSHLLCGPDPGAEGTWRMNVIDLSTPALGPDEPGWAAQSPLQDLVAVQRALEYFAADEAAYESARRLGVDSLETMRGALDGAPGWAPADRAVLRQVFHTADVWRERALRLLLGPTAESPLRRLLYLRRLLHELAYNCAHARPYHAAIDLRHALALGDARTPALSTAASSAASTSART